MRYIYQSIHKHAGRWQIPEAHKVLFPGVFWRYGDTGILLGKRKHRREHLQPEQTLLWYEQHYHKTGRNTVDFYRIICIRDESVPDSEANTLFIY